MAVSKDDVKEILYQQLQLLAEESKKTDALFRQPLSFTEKVELAAHIDRKVKSFEICRCLLDEVYRDVEQQLKREFGLKDVFDLPFELLYEAHEFIDCYELPFALREKIKVRKRRVELYG